MMKTIIIRCGLFMAAIMSVAGIMAADGNHRDFSPKTPEAAAFQQVGDIPVGNYTGTMNLSIPIYTIECGDLKVPISLDYLGSAIRVDQEATWVGLNWLLNAGGAITTRISASYDQTNGIPGSWKSEWRHLLNRLSLTKAYPNGGCYDYRIFYKFDGFHPVRGGYGREWFQKTSEVVDTTNYPNDIPYHLYGTILTHGDGESPTYNANFLGHHISFIWDRLEEEFFITGNADGCSISGTSSMPIITDGNGIKYTFGAMEQGYPEGTDVDPNLIHFDVTLYLTKIESPTGSTISFSYRNYGVTRPVYKVNETIYDQDYPLQPLIEEVNRSMTTKLNDVGTGSHVLRVLSPYYNFQPQRLDNIRVDEDGDGSYELMIKFNLNSTPRQDIRGDDYSLKNIEIYKKQANNTDALLKRFQFQYSYFGKNTTGGNVVKELLGTTYNDWLSNDDFMYYRLKLDKMWEETVEGTTIKKKPAYQFGYSDKLLPCKSSAAIDYWGYYNGKENYNGSYHTLIPKGWSMPTYDDASNFPDAYLSQYGADRRADASYAQAGMLTYVVYPTGASANFEYETNTFPNYDYLDADRTSKTIPFNQRSVYSCNATGYQASGPYIYKEVCEFTVDRTADFELETVYTKSDQQSKSYWREFIYNPVILLKSDNGSSFQRHSLYFLDAADTLSSSVNISKKHRITLSPGHYKIRVNSISSSTYPAAFYEMMAKINIIQPDWESKGAGLRIKSIRYVSDGGTMTTNYDYSQEGKTISSGQLMAPAIFARQKLLIYQSSEFQYIGNNPVNPQPPSEIRYMMASGDNLTPPAAYNVCYDRVTVTKSGDSDGNGKSVFEYNNQKWCNGLFWDFMRRLENPLNGMLLYQRDYNSSGQLVRQIQNTYQMNCVSSRLRNAVVENVYYGPHGVTGGNALVSYNAYADVLGGGCMMIYLYPSVQFSLQKTTTVISDYVGNNSLAKTIETEYNQQNHQESIVKESTSRSGEIIQTETLYPVDYTNYANATTLKNKHIINVPMEVVKSAYNGGSLYVADAERREYDQNGLPTAYYSLKTLGLPRSSFTLSNSNNAFSNYESIASISYNSLGRPRTVTEYGHIPTTYVWGYKSTLPIAVVRGATSSQVTSALGGASSWENLEKALVPTMTASALHAALSGISGALVTVYEHNPYIGMVKSIAPNGETTTYDYDSFARLIRITDHSGTITNKFQYHYRNE